MSFNTKLAIVVPCYNEELVIESTVETLVKLLNELILKGKISANSYIYLIDDGSSDRTWEIITRLNNTYN